MYITTGTSKHYTVLNQQIAADEVRYALESVPAALGATVSLYTADGSLCLRTDTVADWEHPRIEGNTIILSNIVPVGPILPVLKDVQESKIALSKKMLAEHLEEHPLIYTDGKSYSVTAEKQSLLTGNLSAYSIATQLGVTPNPLMWNTTGSECTEWTFADLGALALAIQAYVKPFVSYQQSKEVEIKACTTVDEVETVVINYDSVKA